MVNGQKQSLSLGQSPDGRQPSPLTSPLLTDAGFVRTDDEDEVRRKVCLLESACASKSSRWWLSLAVYCCIMWLKTDCCENVTLNLSDVSDVSSSDLRHMNHLENYVQGFQLPILKFYFYYGYFNSYYSAFAADMALNEKINK